MFWGGRGWRCCAKNIGVSVAYSQNMLLLLGRTAMDRFGTITIDTTSATLTIEQKWCEVSKLTKFTELLWLYYGLLAYS